MFGKKKLAAKKSGAGLSKLKYQRVMLKISGEVLGGDLESGIDFEYLNKLAKEIAEVKKTGVQLAIVVGGGNYWRFRDFQHSSIPRVESDYLGMMATVFNCVALKSALKVADCPTEVYSALSINQLVEPYVQRKALLDLENDKIVICAGGTGNPFCTTDSAAALRAAELGCQLLMKATNVDYVYDSDPNKNTRAKPYKTVTYSEILEKRLGVMDLGAIATCMEAKLPISIFNLTKSGNIKRVLFGEPLGTIVKS
ncbi:MAG: UMP kinase [Candidatus Altimarinota bacterium]